MDLDNIEYKSSKRNVNSPYFQFLNKVPLHTIMADLLKWSLDNIEYKSVFKRIRHNRMQTYFILKIIQKLTSSLFTCGTR